MHDDSGRYENNQPKNKTIAFLLIYRTFDLLEKLIVACVYIVCAYFIYLSIDSLAGKTTLTNIVLSYLSERESDYGFPWILAFVFFVWAILERKERQRKVESLHKHNRELEERMNPGRTSSGLLPNGETNPKDDIL
jgi:hypothetical protein